MSLDEALLVTSPSATPRYKVRVYGWDRITLTVGAHMTVDPATVRRCEQESVGIVRRATGGGAVLHSNDVTYSVVAPMVGGGVLGSYRWVAKALIGGLERLGIRAEVVEHGVRADAIACFAKPTGADLQAGGAKICGSAQLRRKGWFLQHGSIPLTDNTAQTQRLLGIPPGKDVSTSVWKFREAPWDEVAVAVMQGFRDAWGFEELTRPPAPEEADTAQSLVETRYSSLITL